MMKELLQNPPISPPPPTDESPELPIINVVSNNPQSPAKPLKGILVRPKATTMRNTNQSSLNQIGTKDDTTIPSKESITAVKPSLPTTSTNDQSTKEAQPSPVKGTNTPTSKVDTIQLPPAKGSISNLTNVQATKETQLSLVKGRSNSTSTNLHAGKEAQLPPVKGSSTPSSVQSVQQIGLQPPALPPREKETSKHITPLTPVKDLPSNTGKLSIKRKSSKQTYNSASKRTCGSTESNSNWPNQGDNSPE